MSIEKNKTKKNTTNFSFDINILDKIDTEKKGSDKTFLCQKRKCSFEPIEKELDQGQIGEDIFCQNCKNKIGPKGRIDLNLGENEINNYLTKLLFDNKKEITNIISDSLNDFFKNNEEKKKKLFFLKKFCNLCIQKIFIKGIVSNLNLLINNKSIEKSNEGEELKSILSKNNAIEEIIKEITSILNNLNKKKLIYKKDESLIKEIKNKICQNIENLNENNKIFDKIIHNNNIGINEKEKVLINKINKEKKIIKNEGNDENVENEEKQINNYKISDRNIITCCGKFKGKNDSIRKYTILSKEYIYESKYEKIQKNKTSKIFQYNSFNQFKNYIHNSPVLINQNNNNEKNNTKNYNIINSLSQIKSQENNCNLNKTKINSNIMMFNQPSELEKQISKIKDKDGTKIYNNLNIDYNFPNNNLLNQSNEFNNNPEINNNNLENNINNKNILLKYLISSYQVNQKLLNQINLGINPINSIIAGINNNNIINEIINTNNLENNFNNMKNQIITNPIINPIIKNPIYNGDNFGNLNSPNQFFNDNLNFYNNIKSFYNPNFFNNNLNRYNIGNSLIYSNVMPENQNFLINNNENLNINGNNTIKDKSNVINKNKNSILNEKNVSNINSFNSSSLNDINHKKSEENRNEKKEINSENESKQNDNNSL